MKGSIICPWDLQKCCTDVVTSAMYLARSVRGEENSQSYRDFEGTRLFGLTHA